MFQPTELPSQGQWVLFDLVKLPNHYYQPWSSLWNLVLQGRCAEGDYLEMFLEEMERAWKEERGRERILYSRDLMYLVR